MLVIGLTGGIGTGKSTVADLFVRQGIQVIDADEIAHQLTQPGQVMLDDIRSLFGDAVFHDDGSLDRKRLREIVFHDADKRQQLEQLLHPKIRQTIHSILQNSRGTYCIVSIPLLIEAGWQDMVDRVLVVDAEPEQQLDRTMARDELDEQQVREIMAAQLDRQSRLQAADDVVENTGNLAHLAQQVARLHISYLEQARNKDQ